MNQQFRFSNSIAKRNNLRPKTIKPYPLVLVFSEDHRLAILKIDDVLVANSPIIQTLPFGASRGAGVPQVGQKLVAQPLGRSKVRIASSPHTQLKLLTPVARIAIAPAPVALRQIEQ